MRASEGRSRVGRGRQVPFDGMACTQHKRPNTHLVGLLL